MLNNLVFILGVFQLFCTVGVFCVIKFNDLRHLAIDIKQVIVEQKEMQKSINALSEEVSYIKGKIDL
jgi:hypothetical protein